jgi:hypothetical protein
VVFGGRVVGTWSSEKGNIVPDLWEKVPKTRLKEELERVREVPPDPAPQPMSSGRSSRRIG